MADTPNNWHGMPWRLLQLATTALGEASGGSVAGATLQAVLQRRLNAARDILVEELRFGDRTLASMAEEDEAAAILFRYAQAAQEGAARLNLRLMAKVITGQAHLGNLVADEFLYYANLLSSLRREEIILTATLHRLRQEKAGTEFSSLSGAKSPDIWGEVGKELIPDVFPDDKTIHATALAVGRTGLVMTDTTLDGIAYFTTSPLMDRLLKLASLEEALDAEPKG